MVYTTANRAKVFNEGQKSVLGKSEDGVPLDFVLQVGDVTKTLLSVRKIKQAGNIISTKLWSDMANFDGSKYASKQGPQYPLQLWPGQDKLVVDTYDTEKQKLVKTEEQQEDDDNSQISIQTVKISGASYIHVCILRKAQTIKI